MGSTEGAWEAAGMCVGLIVCQHDLLQQRVTAQAAGLLLLWLRLAVSRCKDRGDLMSSCTLPGLVAQ